MNRSVKRILWFAFLASVTMAIAALLTGLVKPVPAWVWLMPLTFAGIIALFAVFGEGGGRSTPRRDVYRPTNLVSPPAQPDQFGVSYQTDPKRNRSEPDRTYQFWGTVPQGTGAGAATADSNIAAGVGKHGWFIVGFLLSIATVWFGYNHHQTPADWAVILVLFAGAVLCFAQEFGQAKNFLGGWWGKGLPVTWFVLSIIFGTALLNDAQNKGIPFWSAENWVVWAAILSLLASGITLFGGKEAWKEIGKSTGKGIAFFFAELGKTLFFLREKARWTSGLFAWSVLLFLSGVVLVSVRNLDLDFMASVYEIQALGISLGMWMIALGFFSLIFLMPVGAKFDIESKKG